MSRKECSSRQQDINYKCEACLQAYGSYVSSLFKELSSEDPRQSRCYNFSISGHCSMKSHVSFTSWNHSSSMMVLQCYHEPPGCGNLLRIQHAKNMRAPQLSIQFDRGDFC